MTKPVYGNCIQQTAYALLRGFGDRLVVLKSRSRVWPIHLAIEFDRDCDCDCDPWSQNIRSVKHYAFETTKDAEFYAPWWFIGRWRPIDTEKVIERRRFTLSRRQGIAFTLALIALVFAPWCIAWACYQPCYMAWWMREAIQHRRGNRCH